MVLRVVVLPAPLEPMSVTISPLRDLEVDALERVDLAVVGVDVRSAAGASSPSAAVAGSAAVAATRAHVADAPRYASMTLGSARTSCRRALGDPLAVIEHGIRSRDAHHHAHVVLDEQDREAQVVAQTPR